MNVFFRSFGKTYCQDVCAAVPDGLNDTARWTVCSSGSDHWLGHRMSKGLVTFRDEVFEIIFSFSLPNKAH